MDMKSYILVGGGLLICLVLLHALVSARRARRRVPQADGMVVEPDGHEMEAETGAGILWKEEAEAELIGEPIVEEFVAEDEPGPPALMESTAAADDAPFGDGIGTEPSPQDATTEVDEDPEGLRKGRRIEIAGKRTEPTVPRAMRAEFHEFTPPEQNEARSDPDIADSLDEVIVVWLFARPGRQLDGETLLKTFVSHGLKCDADRVFKKADPRCGGPWYAVANGVEPGTFDISRPAALETPGVVMLLNLGEVRDPGPAFEDMLDVAQDLAIALDAELKDERMSDMSAQTIEHCRQRIRDHRRMLLRA